MKFSGSIGRRPIQDELDKLTDEQLIKIAEMSIVEEKKWQPLKIVRLIAIAEGTSNLIAELGERCEREVMTES